MITIRNKEVSEECRRLIVDQIMKGSFPVDVGGKIHDPIQMDAFDYRYCNTELKAELSGKYYLSWPTEAGRWMKIIDCYMIKKPHHICDGLALLLEDNFWRFGCSKRMLKTEEELRGAIRESE